MNVFLFDLRVGSYPSPEAARAHDGTEEQDEHQPDRLIIIRLLTQSERARERDDLELREQGNKRYRDEYDGRMIIGCLTGGGKEMS